MSYTTHPGVNISTLKWLWSRSPLHYRHLLDNPPRQTDALELGTALHMAALERDRFLRTYIVEPEFGDVSARNGTSAEQARENKRVRNAWWSEHAGQDITSHRAWTAWRRENELAVVSDKWRRQIEGMSDAMMRHPVSRRYLIDGGDAELPIYWIDEETRVSCKARLDLFGPRATVGLKSSRDAAPRAFQAQAARLGYHLQWAYYHDGLLASGRDPGDMVEIVVESEAPHDVAVYLIDEDTLDAGRDAYRESLVRLAYCREQQDWHGVAPTEEVVFRLPQWARQNDDDNLDGLEWE